MLLKLPSGVFLNGYEFFSASGNGSPLNIFQRPSYITDFTGIQSAFFYQTYYQSMNVASSVITMQANRRVSIGLGIRLLDIPGIERRVADGNGGYISQGTINTGSIQLPMVLGLRMSRYFQVGISGGYYSEQLDRKTVSSFVFGGELKLSNLFNRTFSVNAGIVNLGKGLTFVEEQYPLPVQWHVNVVHVNPVYPFSVIIGLQKEADKKTEYQLGIEYQYFNKFFLNSGYEVKEGLSKGLILGFGIQQHRVRLAYVYQPQNYLGDMHKMELVLLVKKPSRIGHVPEKAGIQAKRPPVEKYPLNTPVDLQGDYLAGTLMLGWKFEQAGLKEPVLFDVYAALHKEGPWFKISGKGLKQSRITFNPQKSGKLYFRVRARSGKLYSDYSKIIKINISR